MKKAANKPPRSAGKKQSRTVRLAHGNCYQLAATAFLGLLGAEYWSNILGAWLEEQGIEPRNPELVHGFPFQPDYAGGQRIGHAWIECHHRGKKIVIDLGNGRKITPTLHQRNKYYSLGRIDGKECHHYENATDVAKLIGRIGLWGPWGAVPEDAVVPGLKGTGETKKKRKGN